MSSQADENAREMAFEEWFASLGSPNHPDKGVLRIGFVNGYLAGVVSNLPHKCPACDGSGWVSRPPWIAGDQQVWDDSSALPYPCNACNGSGIIWQETKNGR
jgi:hypothetical protein